MAANRLMKELREARQSKETDIVLGLADTNTGDLFKWAVVLQGPEDTPYAGGTFRLLLRVPSDYPIVPPTATFLTKVFHPNVAFPSGEVCLDILKSKWSPAWTLASVCRAVQSLLTEPEASSPLNCDAGNLIRAGDMVAFNSMARMYAVKEAGAKEDEW